MTEPNAWREHWPRHWRPDRERQPSEAALAQMRAHEAEAQQDHHRQQELKRLDDDIRLYEIDYMIRTGKSPR